MQLPVPLRCTKPEEQLLGREEQFLNGHWNFGLKRVHAKYLNLNCVGSAPTFENIISRDYEVSRSMYFYVKREHLPLVPGLMEFVEEFTQEDAWGPDGYLAEKGLIPLMPDERASVRAEALSALTDPKNPPLSENDPSPPQNDETPPG